MDTKTCTTCNQALPLDAFYRSKTGRSRGATCKTCEKAHTTAWRRTETGRASAQRTLHKYNKSERGKANRTAYNRSEKARAMKDAWQKSEAGRLSAAKYRKTDKRKAVLKRHYESGTQKATIHRYQQTDKGRESLLRGVHKRRANLAQADCTLTAQEWQQIQANQNHLCAICGERPSRLTRDHIIPLTKGGTHTAANIQALCRGCNSRKGNKTP